MASRSLGTLTIDLLTRTGAFEQGWDRAQRTVQRKSRDINRDAQQSTAQLERIWSGAAAAISGHLAAAFSVAAVVRYADAYTELQNRLRLVTDSTESLARATGDVFDIALGTAQSVDSIAQVYQRFAQNADSLGISLQDVADLTTTVAQAVAVSGASASAAEAALTQFGQALASGTLRGEELNSVMEQTPGLARAIADGLNIPIGQLRQLAADGKITSDALVQALRNAAQGVGDQFGSRVLTIGQAFENLNTAATKVVGTFDSSVGASSSLANSLDDLAQWVAGLSEGMDTLATDADAVREVLASLNEFAERFNRGFAIDSQEAAGAFADSFTESFLATAKEIDFIAADFQGFFGGISRTVSALGLNIQNSFANAFDGVLAEAVEFVNGLSDRLSSVSEFFGGGRLGQIEYGGTTDRPTYSLSDSYVAGYQESARGLGAYESLLSGIATRAINRAADQAEQTYEQSIASGVAKAAAESESKGTKERIDQGQRLIDQMRERIELIGKETEYEKLLAQISLGTITFRTQAQQEQALAAAQTLDFINEQNEAYEESQKYLERISKVSQETGDEVSEFAREAARSIQQSLGDGLYDVLQGNFDNIGDAFANTILRMAADAAAANLAGALFGDFGNTGRIGGLIGNVLSGLFSDPITAAPGATIGGNGAAVGSFDNLRYFSDGGYTGPGGKYDVAGVVHAGEYVLNAETTRRLGVGYLDRLNGYAQGGYVGRRAAGMEGGETRVEIINNGTPQRVTGAQRSLDAKGTVIRIFVEDIRRNGESAQAIRGLMEA